MINDVFVGEPVAVTEDARVTINCSLLIDQAIASGIPNSTISWFKDGDPLANGSAPNVEISEDGRLCIINDTLLAVGDQLGNDGDYTCQVCADATDANCINRTTSIAVCGE